MSTIALPIPVNSPTVTAFEPQLERYLQLREVRTVLEAHAAALLSQSLDSRRLKTAPAVGAVIALQLLAHCSMF
jgi:hypothetical protein